MLLELRKSVNCVGIDLKQVPERIVSPRGDGMLLDYSPYVILKKFSRCSLSDSQKIILSK